MILSTVIVSWNTRELLAICLRSLQAELVAFPTREVEIIVVDNDSSDGSAEMVRSHFPQVKLIDNQKNVGFARANNQAMRQCLGRYILLLNPDTVVRAGALMTIIEFMGEHPHAGAAGARLLNPDGTLQISCYPAPTLSRECFRLFHLDVLWSHSSYQMQQWDWEAPRRVECLLGACLLLRSEILKQIGYLDEDYFIYSEEIDLCLRIRQAGWDIYWVPQAEIIHYGGQSTQQIGREMFLQLYQSKLLYFQKHHGSLAGKAYWLILLLAAVGRLAISPLAWLEKPPQRRRHLVLTDYYWTLTQTLLGA